MTLPDGPAGAPGFARAVFALLRAARRRAAGRLRRARELRRKRGGGAFAAFFAPVILVAMAGGLNVIAAVDLATGVVAGERLVADGAPAALPDIVALAILLVWMLMLVCQGESLDTSTQRTRQPMWEWLFTHPAPPAAIFLAEMLAPVAANPAYTTAPLFAGVLFGAVYDVPRGILAGFVVGVPAMLALACAGKAVEVYALLRLPPSARGAVLGIMGWFGFASATLFFFAASSVESAVQTAADWLAPLGALPWPPVRLLVGHTASGESFRLGVFACWGVSAIVALLALGLAAAGARDGLVGRTEAPARVATPTRFGRDPLYRKELLWFRRDRRALVQALLVPLSLAALQTFNLGRIVREGAGGWTSIAGIAILFGTYFLLTLGPQSLASEGQALWIAQTWPRGLESLLAAKAKLWSALASVVVGAVLVYAAWLYPTRIPAIAGVFVLWLVFARSLAEKTVTLATLASSSGEVERPPAGRRGAAMLGTLSFAVGVVTEQWSLAITGVVYSIMTAAAMWQNFRHRLPFLADPWSETLPPAPTLMHAMIAIAVMVELVSISSGIAYAAVGGEADAIRALFYGIGAIVVAIGLGVFLDGRGVAQRDIWLWPAPGRDVGRLAPTLEAIVAAAALGAALGCAAHLFLSFLARWPDLARLIDASRAHFAQSREARVAYLVMAVGFAPPAEEYLFRGLLYRALDREWGGWRAVAGTAAFFAIYHPLLSWAPVAALGALNAVLFKRSGRLVASVAAHMAYNAVVLGLAFR